jgi:four helix bundle protein
MSDRRPPAKSFQDLLVWRKAHQLVLGIYTLTTAFPKAETYGLSLQIRRSAVSIPANIAEGFRRRSSPEKTRFLNLAESSLEETRYYLILAQDLGYGDTDVDELGGRGQPTAERIQHRHSDFLDSWLLTSYPEGISRAKPLPS